MGIIEFDKLKELLKADRSIRRFQEEKEVGKNILVDLIDLTRYCASGRNAQPLRYRIVTDRAEREDIFPYLGWAGYLKEWAGPEKGERPTAYLIQCLDTEISKSLLCDDGIQLQAITLGATTLGIGCCIIKSFNAKAITDKLNLPPEMSPLYVIALGYPVEKVVIEEMTDPGEIEYYRTSDQVHHVPKRPLSELIIN